MKRNEAGQTVQNSIPLNNFVALVKDVHADRGWYERVTEIGNVTTAPNEGGALAVVHYAGYAASTPVRDSVEQSQVTPA